jgi:hypothetical protein
MEKVKDSMMAGKGPAPSPGKGWLLFFIISGGIAFPPPIWLKGRGIDETRPMIKKLF